MPYFSNLLSECEKLSGLLIYRRVNDELNRYIDPIHSFLSQILLDFETIFFRQTKAYLLGEEKDYYIQNDYIHENLMPPCMDLGISEKLVFIRGIAENKEMTIPSFSSLKDLQLIVHQEYSVEIDKGMLEHYELIVDYFLCRRSDFDKLPKGLVMKQNRQWTWSVTSPYDIMFPTNLINELNKIHVICQRLNRCKQHLFRPSLEMHFAAHFINQFHFWFYQHVIPTAMSQVSSLKPIVFIQLIRRGLFLHDDEITSTLGSLFENILANKQSNSSVKILTGLISLHPEAVPLAEQLNFNKFY